MVKKRKISKRILVSLLSTAMVVGTLEGATFSVYAASLETEVEENETAEVIEPDEETIEAAEETETEAVTEVESETEETTKTEETAETEETVEIEETSEAEETTEIEETTETEEVSAVEETEIAEETVTESELIIETEEETTEPDMVVLEEQSALEEGNYGELLASGNCGASYQENNETKTYDVTWAVYDSNTDGNDTADNGDLLVISGSGV